MGNGSSAALASPTPGAGGFAGLLHRRFFCGFANIAKPPRKPGEKLKPFQWSAERGAALAELKEAVVPFSVSGHIFPNPFHMRQMLLLTVSRATQEPKALGRMVAHYSRNLGSPEVIYCREGLPGRGQTRRTFKRLSLCTQLWGPHRSRIVAAALPGHESSGHCARWLEMLYHYLDGNA